LGEKKRNPALLFFHHPNLDPKNKGEKGYSGLLQNMQEYLEVMATAADVFFPRFHAHHQQKHGKMMFRTKTSPLKLDQKRQKCIIFSLVSIVLESSQILHYLKTTPFVLKGNTPIDLGLPTSRPGTVEGLKRRKSPCIKHWCNQSLPFLILGYTVYQKTELALKSSF